MSPAWLLRFVSSAGGDKHLALRVYVWNARLCEEFYIPLQFTEVAIRNAIHWRLCHLYSTNWFDEKKFIDIIPNRHRNELADAVAQERAKRGSKFQTDHVVAGMSFGFWLNLMGHALSHNLWRSGVRSGFPHAPVGTKREDVYVRMDQMRNFRNAVMHHYAIFDKRPSAEYQNLRVLLSWLCPDTLWLVSELSNPAAVLRQRPKI